MPPTLIDVHAIADDHRQNPIGRWGVFAVATGERLGTVTAAASKSFSARTSMGEVTLHAGLREARDAIARAFTAPGRVC